MWFDNAVQNAFYRARLRGAKFFCMGRSALGKPILCAHVGSCVGPQILVHGAIHAREYITTLLVCRQIEYAIKNHRGVGGIYFIPLVNPDGVDIVINGTNNIAEGCRKCAIEAALKSKDHRLFKANANLVDLNVNFDARWGGGKNNVFKKDTENFIGCRPHSEPETRALADFTLRVRPCFTISYHSKGEEIYYKFYQRGLKNKLHRAIALSAARRCGYAVKTPRGSTGGFKDWCVQHLDIPSITIEVGADVLTHPILPKHLPSILARHLKLPLKVLEDFVRCDIMLSCQPLIKNKKKTICALRYFRQSARAEKMKYPLAR